MQVPVQLKPALWGAVGGATALAVLGFNWGGWVTGSTAEAMAKEKSSAAVVAAQAPICVDNFKRSKDAPAQLAELKKIQSWEQTTFVEKGGWAKMPGSMVTNNAMARACAEMIVTDKS